MVKDDRPVFYFINRILRILQSALFSQHLYDTLRRLVCHRNHHEYHGKHHQTVQHHEVVGQKRGKLSHIQSQSPGSDNRIRAEGKHEYHHSIDTELHHGTIESQDSFRLRKIRADVFCRRAEFLFLIVFTHKRFHHAHGLDIFLNGTVQIIVLFKYLFEQRHGPADHKGQPRSQKRNGQKENPCHSSSHDKRHGKGKNQHQRGAHRHTDNHHVSQLYVSHVCGHTRYQRRNKKFVNVFKRILLYAVKHIFAEVLRQSAGRFRAAEAGHHTQKKRKQRHNYQDHPVLENNGHGASGLNLIHQHGHNKRDDTFQHHFQSHPDGRHDRCFLVFPDTFCQFSYHVLFYSSFS